MPSTVLRRIGAALAVGALSIGLLASCSSKPDLDDLTIKLRERNGLTTAEASCIRDQLVKTTDPATLRRISEARTGPKLEPRDAALVTDAINVCIPAPTAPPVTVQP